jgi:hypothetical protein
MIVDVSAGEPTRTRAATSRSSFRSGGRLAPRDIQRSCALSSIPACAPKGLTGLTSKGTLSPGQRGDQGPC